MIHNLCKLLAALLMMISMSACSPGELKTALSENPNLESILNESFDESASDSAKEADEALFVSEAAKISTAEVDQILSQYSHLDPNRVVPSKHLANALIYFDKNKSRFKNQRVISIIDFSKRSTEKRWYFINLKSGSVTSLHVAHGGGSDLDNDGYADRFSNVSGSNATSLGFYRTAETYHGQWGYSLRIDGLSSTNSNARRRAVVIHGASDVLDKSVLQGRTRGCPAVSMENHKKVIDLVKGGSLIYAAAE